MGRVRICVGGYAKSPYVIRQAGVRLYAVEELCYYLEHYAVLLDDDMMNEELFTWIEEELELGDLARSFACTGKIAIRWRASSCVSWRNAITAEKTVWRRSRASCVRMRGLILVKKEDPDRPACA